MTTPQLICASHDQMLFSKGFLKLNMGQISIKKAYAIAYGAKQGDCISNLYEHKTLSR
jgi:hypothetical protein